jgi:hypothetical protein
VLKTFASILILTSSLVAQPQNAGLSPDWDIRKDMADLAEQIRRLQPMVDKVKPDEWVAKGAPATYVTQMASLQAGMRYLVATTETLARNPERLTVALDTYFRMQSVELLVNSLREGLRRYQSPDLANMINDAMVRNSNNREKLRTHIVDLAAAREQEFQIVDQEAQRCRGMILRTPANPLTPEKRKIQKPEPK